MTDLTATAAAPVATSPRAAERVAGLDSLRALAIVFVLAYHHMLFVSRQPDLGWFSNVGWVGVDLFFVLSGYLIGNQILGPLRRGEGLSLWRFYARRLLRTVPAFWAMLALYFSFPGELGGREPPPLWRFVSFTQNIQLPPGTAFSHAWSLCIEEQFYLLLPLLALAGARWPRSVRTAWLLWAAAIACACVLRGWLWQRYGLEAGGAVRGYHPHLYYATLCRADEFLPGLGVAMLRHWHPAAWQRLMANGRWLLALSLAAMAAALWGAQAHYYAPGVGYGEFMTTFGYSLIALAFGLLLLATLSPTTPLHHWRLPGAAALAAWSYSIYLSHKAIGHLVLQALQVRGVAADSTWTLGIAMLCCLLGGWTLYLAVERPFLKLRQRWVPARAQPAQPAPAHRAASETTPPPDR